MPNYFIGRQPIFNRSLGVYAYELLFREGYVSDANVFDDEQATSQVMITALSEIGLDRLVEERLAFVNLSAAFLKKPELIIFPKDRVVLEILEDTPCSNDVIAGIKVLTRKGFTFALDDFVPSPEREPLLEFAKIVKIDINLIDPDELPKLVNDLKASKKQLIAERVETIEDFERLKELDFDYYQGYFFAKPKIVSGKKITGSKAAMVELLARVYDPEIAVEDLKNIINRDVSLSLKALRFANSPANGMPTTIESVQQAVVYLGVTAIKNWVTILTMSSMGDKPNELLKLALIRGKMCSLMASWSEMKNEDTFFTVGMFSVLDAMLDIEMKKVVESLPLEESMLEALLDHKGVKGEALACAIKMELGHDEDCCFGTLIESAMNDIYLEALHWADVSLSSLK